MKQIIVLVGIAALASALSAQTLKDRNMSKIRHDGTFTARSKSSGTTPPTHIRQAPPVSVTSHPGNIDRQLSAMQRRTQAIAGTSAPRKKAAKAPVYVAPKAQASTGGFNATPYIQKRKSMTVTNPSHQRSGSRSLGLRKPGR